MMAQRIYQPVTLAPTPQVAERIQYPRSSHALITNTGLPINTQRGCITTEVRGVHVSGLNFKASDDDVRDYFTKAGDVVYCNVKTDSSGKSKGWAILRYASSAQAARAVSMLNRNVWMGKELKVKWNTQDTPDGPSTVFVPRSGTPLVVNGS